MAISPGSVVDVGELVTVDQGATIDGGGGFYLTTVRLTPVTLLEAMQGWVRPEVDVVDRTQVAPSGLQPQELRQLNLDQMDVSKRQALGAAFEALGYDAVSGDGAEVVDLAPGGPAEGVLELGDVIVGLAGVGVTSHYDVLRILAGQRPGARVELEVDRPERDGRGTVVLDLGRGRESPHRAELGTTLRTRRPRFDFPVDVDIATDRIGGPSGGLAFTLQVLDALTEGDLTGGRRVAATGTMELDGSVGEVGGVGPKAAALEHHAIDVFLVPGAEVDEASALVGRRVQVAPVDTLDEALRVLADGGGVELPRRW